MSIDTINTNDTATPKNNTLPSVKMFEQRLIEVIGGEGELHSYMDIWLVQIIRDINNNPLSKKLGSKEIRNFDIKDLEIIAEILTDKLDSLSPLDINYSIASQALINLLDRLSVGADDPNGPFDEI